MAGVTGDLCVLGGGAGHLTWYDEPVVCAIIIELIQTVRQYDF